MSSAKFNAMAMALAVINVLAISGCIGGTIGTGVRKYNAPETSPEKEERSLFGTRERVSRCTIDASHSEYEVSMQPVAGLIDAEEVDSQTCRAAIIPLSHTVTVRVLKDGDSLGETDFQLQSALSRNADRWRLEKSSVTKFNPKTGEFGIEIPTRVLSLERYYRLMVLTEDIPSPLIFEFTLGQEGPFKK